MSGFSWTRRAAAGGLRYRRLGLRAHTEPSFVMAIASQASSGRPSAGPYIETRPLDSTHSRRPQPNQISEPLRAIPRMAVPASSGLNWRGRAAKEPSEFGAGRDASAKLKPARSSEDWLCAMSAPAADNANCRRVIAMSSPSGMPDIMVFATTTDSSYSSDAESVLAHDILPHQVIPANRKAGSCSPKSCIAPRD